MSDRMANSNQLTQAQLVGRIQSVYCKDFVSYSEITYFPGEYLNVLTGPNGTGKSTIVSAIILGLGGEPQLLDRSSSISDYIKSNKNTATVIITIFGKQNDSKEAFKRIIDSNGHSRYFVNSKELSKSKFLNIIATYNIQVNNLCQFLPQDRVQDFSKMNPQELLMNTITSVCDNQLIQHFNDLREMRKSQKNAHVNKEREQETLLKEETKLDQLRISVNQHKERQEIQEKLNIYKAKKLCVEIDIKHTMINDYKSKLNEAKVACETVQKTYECKKRAQEEISKKDSFLKKNTLEKIQLINNSMATKSDLISQLDIIKHKINESKCDLERNIQKSTKSINDVDKIKYLIKTKQQELQQFSNDKNEAVNNLENLRIKLQKNREATMNQYSKRREFETILNDEKIPEITALTHKLERLQNIKPQKIEEMRVRHPDVFKAMSWVAQNRHRYKCNVYNPMVVELSMQSDEGAMYLENVVRQRDLYAFSCEDKDDMSYLINELCVKQKLSVNFIYCAQTDISLFTASVPIAEIMQFGFNSYLVDLVSGPIPIINKLCSTYHIHNIPIGKDEVSNFTSSVPTSIRIYFGGSKKFSVTTSRYRSDLILTETTVRRKFQLISLDTSQLALVNERFSKLILEKDQLRNSIREIDTDFERLQMAIREDGDKRRKYEQKLAHYESLETDVKKLQIKVDTINKSFQSLETVKNTFHQELFLKLRHTLKMESNLINILVTTNKLQSLKKLNQMIESVHKQHHDTQIDAFKESEEQYRKATSAVDKLRSSLKVQLQEIQSKTSEVKDLCNGQLPSSESFPYKSDFEQLSDFSLEKIHEAIIEFQARLECMENLNTQILADYQQQQGKVDQLKKSIENKSSQEKQVNAKILNLFNEWEPKLIKLIETINTKFSEFMDSIAYVGEVVLSKKDKIDFDSYGIQIMVQYRKDAKLQTLDKYIQSGGERAVAIAIYSLSLQHVTHVPFRCVDEINQGMDAKNERHIFDLLLKEATKQGSAQYLFVTPKLLRDLSFNQRLCVSVVHNSGSIKSNICFPLN